MRQERFIKRDISNIQQLCNALNVDAGGAAAVYREAVARGLLRQCHVGLVVAASVYVSIRRSGEPNTIQEIIQNTNEKGASIGRAARMIDDGMPPQDVRSFIERGIKRLNLPSNIQDSMGIDDFRCDLGAPIRAAIMLYMTAHKTVTIQGVADAVGVNVGTLRNYVKTDGTLKVDML